MSQENILLTGATGAFGRYLPQELNTNGDTLTALIRADSDEEARTRLEPWLGGNTDQVHILSADLTQDNFGLSEEAYSRLQESVTGVMHAAASTRFDLPFDQAHESNVQTLGHVLSFSRGSRNLRKFGFVSTAFSAGRNTGFIAEEEHDPSAGFVNTYDHTKFDAESMVRDAMPDIPIAVYRPSLVIAPDSAPQHAAVALTGLARRGLIPVLPGHPEDQLDIVTADYASKAIARLFLEHFDEGETYHVVSGELAPTLEDIVALVNPPQGGVTYAGHGLENFEAAVAELLGQRPGLRPFYKRIDHFIKYLCFPKTFDDKKTLGALPHPVDKGDPLEVLRSVTD